MNILQVNKFYWQFGGAERVMLEQTALLRGHGHHVEFFAMDHPRNLESENTEFFTSHIDYRSPSPLYKLKNLARAAAKTIYSIESKKKLARLLANRTVDLAHVHMIEHQLSPSVLHTLRRFNIPTVHTCHDHKLVCPASHLYIEPRHEVCERCVASRRYYNIVRYRCMRGSLGVSLLAGVAHYLHRWTGIYEKNVDLFIAPSRFLAEHLITGGIPENRIRILPNAINIDDYVPEFAVGKYVLYFGRISEEKGIPVLLRTAALLSETPFVLAGEGPHRERFEQNAAQQGIGNVDFVGYKSGDALKTLIHGAALVVLPSECHENFPMVTVEANALGKPVVVTRMGGAPENVDDGETGLIVSPGSPEELAAAIRFLLEDEGRCAEMGRRGRAKAEKLCADHYGSLMAIYDEARAMH